MADNVPGKFYVGDQCLDCDLCRETSPENFGRNDAGGYSCVKKQPETPEEEARCREAMGGCCTETIHDPTFHFKPRMDTDKAIRRFHGWTQICSDKAIGGNRHHLRTACLLFSGLDEPS